MTTKPKVLLDPYGRPLDLVFAPADLDRLHDLVDVIWARDDPMPAEEFAEIREDLFAILTGHWRHGNVRDLPNLRAIMELGGSHPSPDVLDYEACFARGIRVLSCAPAFGPMVAELALAHTLAVIREIVPAHNDFVAGREVFVMPGNRNSYSLFNQRVGFIGYGGLARNLQALLAPFRCDIQVYDPWLPESHLRRQGVTPVALDELMATSKIIYVLAIPSASNRGLLDHALLSLIHSESVLVLISRAHLVDFDALTELLHAGRFRAAIDVFPEEPPSPDHPIRSAPGVLLSAHRAGSVPVNMTAIGRMVVDDLEAMLAGLPPVQLQVAQPEFIQMRGA